MWLFLNADDYNTTILKAFNLGEDTDTVGAIVGGLLGIQYGADNIKESWKYQLKRYDYIVNILIYSIVFFIWDNVELFQRKFSIIIKYDIIVFLRKTRTNKRIFSYNNLITLRDIGL